MNKKEKKIVIDYIMAVRQGVKDATNKLLKDLNIREFEFNTYWLFKPGLREIWNNTLIKELGFQDRKHNGRSRRKPRNRLQNNKTHSKPSKPRKSSKMRSKSST